MNDEMICKCFQVTKGQIDEAIKNGADTVAKISEVTKAGTGCTGCKKRLGEILQSHGIEVEDATPQKITNELDTIKEAIVTNVYHITPDMKVPPHRHDDNDEIFYCIKGSGIGILEGKEKVLTVGKEFIVPAGERHTLKTDTELYVTSFLIPVIKQQ